MQTDRMARWALASLPLIAIVAISASRQEPTTVAWVNSGAILQQVPGYAEAETTFAAEIQGYQTEIERLQVELDSAISAYDQQAIVLSPTAREERQRQLRQLQQRLNQRTQELQVRSQQRERELIGPLEDRVQSVIEGVRAERDIGIIFDAAPGSNIVAADRSLDLTATVVQRLQSSQ